MFKIGDKVRIAQNNDNENYEDYRDQILIITHIATNTNEHPGYDKALNGMALYDLKTENGYDVPFSLYEYELKKI